MEVMTIIFGGDMNFPHLKWERKLPKIDLNLSYQEELFVNFMFAQNLLNYVNKPTRNENMLDLILTNDYDMITQTDIEVNNGFSDHNTVMCKLNIDYHEPEKCENIIDYLTSVPKYEWRNGSVDQWLIMRKV